jgi:hypothetical protein
MSQDNVHRAGPSDAPLTAAVHQRDVGHEAAEERGWAEAALVGRTITHRLPLEDAPKGYKMFKEQQNKATKVVLKPDWQKEAA